MMEKNISFLDSANLVTENQAEYAILSALYSECKDMIFLFEFEELNDIKLQYGKITSYIKNNYHGYDLKIFYLNHNADMSDNTIKTQSGTSLKNEELFNIASKRSKENKSYVLIKSDDILALKHKGEFDVEFNNRFSDKQALTESSNNRKDINDLELVFENFHSEQKYKGADYIENGKIKNSISEQQLRNSLIKFLRRATNLLVTPELCTSTNNDEESVDIGVVNSNNEVAIIEVKYFIGKDFYKNPPKNGKYTTLRFRDGYEQLSKYCSHLKKDEYKLHSAFLYMFYAHSDSIETIRKAAQSHYEEFIKTDKCSMEFKRYYKGTFCDYIGCNNQEKIKFAI